MNTTLRRKVVVSSGLFDWQCDEPHRVCGLHPHHDGALACGTRVAKSLAYIGDIRNRFAANVEDHVTCLEPALCGRPIGIDTNHRDTLVARTSDLFGGCEV